MLTVRAFIPEVFFFFFKEIGLEEIGTNQVSWVCEVCYVGLISAHQQAYLQ